MSKPSRIALHILFTFPLYFLVETIFWSLFERINSGISQFSQIAFKFGLTLSFIGGLFHSLSFYGLRRIIPRTWIIRKSIILSLLVSLSFFFLFKNVIDLSTSVIKGVHFNMEYNPRVFILESIGAIFFGLLHHYWVEQDEKSVT